MTEPVDPFGAVTFRRPTCAGGRVLLGVCAGLARRWDLERGTVRAAFAVTLVPFGAGILVYLALAAVMPVDGASARSVGRRGELGRSLAQAVTVLLALAGVALVAGASVALAVFALAPVALLLATVALAAIVVLRDGRFWPLGVVALTLAAPAAVVELTDTTVARQAGVERVAITQPSDVRAAGYRAGLGPLLVDLRDFDADDGSTTTIRARADLRPLHVALPTDRCFNLVVDYRLRRTWVASLLGAGGAGDRPVQSALGYRAAAMPGPGGRDGRAVPALVAYGQAIAGSSGRYVRPVGNPAAPTLHLDLSSGRAQMFLRDQPARVDPVEAVRPPTDRVPDAVALGEIVRRIHRLDPTWSTRPMALGKRQLRAVQQTASRLARRDLWPAEEAARLAGACASPVETARIETRLRAALRRDTRAARRAAAASPITRMAMAFAASQAQVVRRLESR